MFMDDLIHIQIQEHENGTKTVEVVIDEDRKFRFDLSVFPYAPRDNTDLFLHHMERLFHTDPSGKDILYPPPDVADTRELLENQPVDVDTMIVSLDDIAGDLIHLLPEIKQKHNIEGRAAILIVEGKIGLLEVETAASAIEEAYHTDVFRVGFYKDDIPGKVYASLWWFNRRKWSWEM